MGAVGDAGHIEEMVEPPVIQGSLPVEVEPQSLVEANSAFRLDKRSDVIGAHLLTVGAVTQEEALGAAVRVVCSLRDMYYQYPAGRELFDTNGDRRVTVAGHRFDLGNGLVGPIATGDVIVIIDTNEHAPTGCIGKRYQLSGQVGVDALFEFQGVALTLFQNER